MTTTNRSDGSGLSPGRIVLAVVGACGAILAIALMAGGGTLIWAHQTQRDSAGYYTTPVSRFETSTSALTARVDLGSAPGEHGWTIRHPAGTVRVRATSVDGRAIFVGIAPATDVDRWLSGVAHEQVTGPNFGPFTSRSTYVSGTQAAQSPTEQQFWSVSSVGPGTRTVHWPSRGGRWAAVVMNADASPGVAVAVSAGAKTGALLPIGIGLAAAGFLVALGATALLFGALRRHASSARQIRESVPGTYPVRLNGHLDPSMTRWLWLVKWLLLIPHLIVLAVLWMAVSVLTLVAGIAILFTGRYPRSIFDFNLGVMRWTWRVSFYGISAFGTDRYPPFSLRSDPSYPADLDVDFPERLSRGLVLVKWWLLALPHYLVVAVFVGGWRVGWSGGSRIADGGGLIALLSIVAVVVLLVRGRYPESIFDFVMGMNRWCYRVLAYAALMTDEYPPFRLDTGGLDPGSVPTGPAPPAPHPGPPSEDRELPVTADA